MRSPTGFLPRSRVSTSRLSDPRRPPSHPGNLLHRTLPALVAAVLLAGCTGGAASSPVAPSAAPLTPVAPAPTPAGEAGAWLRMTTWQAIPPADQFAVTPAVVITNDGLDVVQGAVPAIFPGPLVIPLFARQVSDAGREQILAWASELGLLSGPTDFTGDRGMPGGVTGRVELTVDGELVTLTGMPGGAPGDDPAPGSPEAFMALWDRVSGLPQQLPDEVGPEQPFTPAGYAVLVGPPPEPQDGMSGSVMDWPLETPLPEFGGPVLDGTYRCGLVEGDDAAVLRPAVEAANQLTQWVTDPETSATYGLTVRPIIAGENPCAEVFGF